MFKKIILFVIISICNSFYSQIGGQSVYQFLSLVNSPRQAALGGKVISFRDDDTNLVLFNPASLNENMNNKLTANYSNYLGEVTYGTATYAKSFGTKSRMFSIGLTYVNYGDFDGYDQIGQRTDNFGASEAALAVGYAYKLPSCNVYFGGNLKLITSSFENYSSHGIATDLGMIYIDDQENLNFSVAVRNAGIQIKTYSGFKEKLPLEILVGVSKDLKNIPVRWHLTLENLQQWNIAFQNPNRAVASIEGETEPEKVSFLNNIGRHVIIGAELFPKKSFNVRLGYNFRRAEELSIVDQRNFSGVCLGFGLKINKLKFNYSYSRYTLAANTSLFGLTINLNNE